jgi:hypothetical protein
MLVDHRFPLQSKHASPKKMLTDQKFNMIDLESKNLIEALAYEDQCARALELH